MTHPLVRRILVFLIAVLVTAGMGLSAVQASTMNMMDMGASMAMPAAGKCQDCGKSGDSKGMAACTAPACAAQIAAPLPLALAVEMNSVPVRHHLQSDKLFGRDSVPDPDPPRTSDIG